MKKEREQENTNKKSKLKIIPLGGLEQIGMNITAFEYEDSIIVVDCGISFPDDDMLGIDLVIPDITYLRDNIDKVKEIKDDKTRIIRSETYTEAIQKHVAFGGLV